MSEVKRRNSKKIFVGTVAIGGRSPVSIQSMTTTDTKDTAATVRQIKKLERIGCQIIRVAVLDRHDAVAIGTIKKKIQIPLVADIHFDYRLALLAIEHGADKIRLNPGNIRKKKHVENVVRSALRHKVPIRIGLNSGSVKRKPGHSLVDDMISSGLSYAAVFKRLDFDQIVFSLKTHDVLTTIEAYRRMARLTDAPFHLGITAAGPAREGIVKSSIGIGALLLEGIGDTIRVSLTSHPVSEVEAAAKILSAVQLRQGGIEIISCPTCGRCTINLIELVRRAEKALAVFNKKFVHKKLTVAIMGCVVNGPQEAKGADVGIAWGGRTGILFKKGKKIRLVSEHQLLTALVREVENEMV